MFKNQRYQKKALAAAVTAACISMVTTTQAQEANDSLLEEVIVTATRRESSIQDIPYNISAMTGDAMEAQHIVNQTDLMRSMYGVSVIDRGYRNSGTVNSIVIRGLNVDNGANGDIMLNAVPTVSTYVDNTPMFANFLLKDIERVEVLRGPQGTLYGSGSLGGTVRYISNRPNPEEFEAKLALDYGQTSGSEGNNLAGDVMINIPLGERAALRASFSRIDNDGVIDYVNAYQLNDQGEPLVGSDGSCVDPQGASDTDVLFNKGCFHSVEDADTVEIDYARISALIEPTDNLAIQLSYSMQEDEIGARRAVTLGDNNQSTSSPYYFSYGDDDSGQVLLEPSSREVELINLDLEWDFGFATFTSSTSSLDHEGIGESDNGGLWASGGRDWNYWFYGGVWPRPAQRAERGYDDESFIQEFRLVSNERKGNIDWLVGAFYMDQETNVWQLSHNPGMNRFNQACRNTADPVCDGFWPRWYPDLTEIDFEYIRDTKYEETAIYGELTYHFSDTVRVTGGLRWFDNDVVNDTILGFPLVVGWSSPSAPQSKDSDSDVLMKLNASWDLSDDKMLYGTYSEGYRHGGAQAVPSYENGDPFGEPNAEALRTFEADTVTNYEIGLKGSGHNLTYTVSMFHVDWDNPQLNTTSAWYGFYVASNGDAASTQGVELEIEGYFNESVHYRAGYTYVKAELDKDFISTQTGAVIASSGSTLPASPSSVLSMSLDKSWNISGSMDLVIGANSYYQSESENFISDDNQLSETFDGFWLVGASATLVSDNWRASLYVKNIGDEAGVTGSFPSSYFSYDTGIFESWYGNGNRQFIVQPRTIGLKIGYTF